MADLNLPEQPEAGDTGKLTHLGRAYRYLLAAPEAAEIATKAEVDSATLELVPASEKGEPGGVATLDSGGLLAGPQRPPSPTRVWSPAGAFGVQSGSPVFGVTETGVAPRWSLAPNVLAILSTSFLVPEGWSTVRLTSYFVNASPNAGDVYLQRYLRSQGYVPGAALTNTTVPGAQATLVASGQWVVQATSLDASLPSGRPYTFGFGRFGNNAGDTLDGAIALLGVVMEKLA